MQRTTLALGVQTALDITTARRLHDYGELDDAGVASALEQMGLQQGVPGGRPGYLTRLARAALVIDSGDDVTLATFEAEDIDAEYDLLQSLFAVMPTTSGYAVSWDASAWELLLRRAYCHALRVPAAVRDWPRQPLRPLFADAEQAPNYDVQADAIGLYGNPAALANAIDPALRLAVHWHAMALRYHCVTGEVDAAALPQRMQRVAARVDAMHAATSESCS